MKIGGGFSGKAGLQLGQFVRLRVSLRERPLQLFDRNRLKRHADQLRDQQRFAVKCLCCIKDGPQPRQGRRHIPLVQAAPQIKG
jgi:hypothetical protein